MTTFKTTTKDFRAWVNAGLSSASRDDLLPLLACAKIAVRAKAAIMTTTDRYTASISRLPLPDRKAKAEREVLIQRSDLMRALAIFKARRGDLGELTVTINAKGMSIADANGATLGLPAWDKGGQEFPRIEKLLRNAWDEGQPAVDKTMSFDLRLIAHWAKLQGFATPAIQVREFVSITGKSKQYAVRIGENFLGLIAPRYLPDAHAPAILSGWDGVIEPKETR